MSDIKDREILIQLLQNHVWIIRYLMDIKTGAFDQTTFSGIMASKELSLQMLDNIARYRKPSKKQKDTER